MNNNKIDKFNYYITKCTKFSLNLILIYFIAELLIYYKNCISEIEFILILCAYCSLVLYILDNYFPSCNIN